MYAPGGDFRARLLAIAPLERDEWLDYVLGTGDLPDDGPDLPRGCVPYIPCGVDALERVVEVAQLSADDVFVDIGSGIGRAVMFAHLWSGAEAIGIEVQPELVEIARGLAARHELARVEYVAADVAARTDLLARGTVFFLYCPFGGDRLAGLLLALEQIARTREIRVCCVDLPLPPCAWLEPIAPAQLGVAGYRSL